MAMRQSIRLPLTLFAAISSALTAGVFFAFSTFVMQALAQQPAASGIATMQSINITVINPWFMMVFFGPAVACALLTVFALRRRQKRGFYLLLGSLLYWIGTIGVTVAGNIPLNDALAVVSPNSVEGVQLWNKYLVDWTLWNHVRTAAALLSSLIFTVTLL